MVLATIALGLVAVGIAIGSVFACRESTCKTVVVASIGAIFVVMVFLTILGARPSEPSRTG